MFIVIKTIIIANNFKIHKIQTSTEKAWYFKNGNHLSHYNDLYFTRPEGVKKGGKRRLIPIIGLSNEDWEEYQKIKDTL